MKLTNIEKIHKGTLNLLLLNSCILTPDIQRAIVFALECIDEVAELRKGEQKVLYRCSASATFRREADCESTFPDSECIPCHYLHKKAGEQE